MFGNFIEAINILQKKLDESKKRKAPVAEQLVLAQCIRELEQALDRYEEDYSRWCENMSIDNDHMSYEEATRGV